MARRVWKSTEITWLRAHYQKLGAKACAEHFGGVTERAVAKAAQRYGIARCAADAKSASEWEIAVIRRCRESGSFTPWLDAARTLGRSRGWVNHQANKMGLQADKGRFWGKGETDFVVKHMHWPAHRIASEMRALGWRRTERAVRHFLDRRGLAGTDTGHMSSERIGEALGVSARAVRRWIHAGLLIAERRSPESTGDLSVAVSEEDLAAFILLNPERVNFTKIEVAQTKTWFLDLISRFPKPPSRMDDYLRRQIESLHTFQPDYDHERIATTLNIEERVVREALHRAHERARDRVAAQARRAARKAAA